MNLLTLRQGNDSVHVCPTRGGIITSLILEGQELLYLDNVTFQDLRKNVRGGIPLLFPNAGYLDSPLYPGLKQHGFARQSAKWTGQANAYTFYETLVSDEETRAIFPYDFTYQVEGSFPTSGCFQLQQYITNHSSKPLPVAPGLHPYFHVSHPEKEHIIWDFPGGEVIHRDYVHWSQGGTTSIPNPCTKDPSATLRIVFPNYAPLLLKPSPAYTYLWIWSLPEQDFVCIEPVFREAGEIVTNPHVILPGEILSYSFTIQREKSPEPNQL